MGLSEQELDKIGNHYHGEHKQREMEQQVDKFGHILIFHIFRESGDVRVICEVHDFQFFKIGQCSDFQFSHYFFVATLEQLFCAVPKSVFKTDHWVVVQKGAGVPVSFDGCRCAKTLVEQIPVLGLVFSTDHQSNSFE